MDKQRIDSFFKSPERCRQNYREAWDYGKAVYGELTEARKTIERINTIKGYPAEKWYEELQDEMAKRMEIAKTIVAMRERDEAIAQELDVVGAHTCAGWDCATCQPSQKASRLREHAHDSLKDKILVDRIRPKIVCFCGSSRFTCDMAVLMWEWEKAGRIAMGLHLLPQSYCDQKHPDKDTSSHMAEHDGVAEKMDDLHLRKIDIADEVFVVNVGGYIGDSTRREIAYATKLGKPIKYLEASGKS